MDLKNKITKGVIPAAGQGTRFLPASKNVVKELMPIINKPMIGYIVDQFIEAGIKDIIIVTRFGTSAVEDYFDAEPALEAYLEKAGKGKLAEMIKKIYTSANFVFVRQDPTVPRGNAAPFYSARKLIGDEPFIYSWGDDIIWGENVGISELVKKYNENPCDAILNCIEVSKEEVSKIGAAVELKKGTKDNVKRIVEKPPIDKVPSNYLSVSPFMFTNKIFDYLKPNADKKTGEFILQPAIQKMIEDGADVRMNLTKGKWLTMGDPLNYLKTTVEVALSRDDLKDDFREYLKKRLEEENK